MGGETPVRFNSGTGGQANRASYRVVRVAGLEQKLLENRATFLLETSGMRIADGNGVE